MLLARRKLPQSRPELIGNKINRAVAICTVELCDKINFEGQGLQLGSIAAHVHSPLPLSLRSAMWGNSSSCCSVA